MRLGPTLTLAGGACLLGGLLLALLANREATRAIRSTDPREDPWGRVRDYGWWPRVGALARADVRFNLGVGLTAIGVILQTIGGVLACN